MSNSELASTLGNGAARVLVSNHAFIAAIYWGIYFLVQLYVPEWLEDDIGFFSVIVVPVSLIIGAGLLIACIYHAVQFNDSLAIGVYGVIFSYFAYPIFKTEVLNYFFDVTNIVKYLAYIFLFLAFFFFIALINKSEKLLKIFQVIVAIPLFLFFGKQYLDFLNRTLSSVWADWFYYL